MTMQFAELAGASAPDGAISGEEIIALRRVCWSDGAIALGEAEAIFALNDRITQPSREWIDFFVEAIGALLIEQSSPRGYVSPEQADWLIARIEADGQPASPAELELLVHLAERASAEPTRLKAFALAQIETAVLTGSGPTRDGEGLNPGCINAAEARLLRRLIFSSGSDGPASVSKAEAELLFRLKDATLGAANAPEWKQLFVQGVGNYLQGMAGAAVPEAAREAELERFMATPERGLGAFMGRMGGALTHPAGLAAAFAPSAVPQRQWQAEADAAAAVTPSEADWLNSEIEADGQHDPYEEALLAFLADG
jgi:hypothetical protein